MEEKKKKDRDNYNLVDVGERLKTARLEMNLSQSYFKDYINAENPQATLSRLEAGIGVNSIVLLKLLNFYYENGYNIDWFLVEDNSNILKKKNLLYSLEFDKNVIIENVNQMKNKLNQMKKNMKNLENIAKEI